jgi:hypothetical protein
VLVKTLYSLISAGTELMKVSEAKLSLLGKVKRACEALMQPLS